MVQKKKKKKRVELDGFDEVSLKEMLKRYGYNKIIQYLYQEFRKENKYL